MSEIKKLAEALDQLTEADESLLRTIANDLLQDATNFHGTLIANKRNMDFPNGLEDALYALTHQLDKYVNGRS